MNIEVLNLDKTTYVQLKRAGVREAEELITRGKEIQLLAPSAYRQAIRKYDDLRGDAHMRALRVHQEIMVSGTTAATNLWTMCQKLKEMRDEKLYKELGYQTFEAYCEEEVGMTRMNVYRYIAIAENIKLKNVTSMLQIGMTKLSLLAQLTEPQQQEITEAVDLEDVSVRQLKEEIAKLKEESESKEGKIKALTEGLSKAQMRAQKANMENMRLEEENMRLEEENKELRARPVDVAVVDNSDSERLLRETIKSLEAENIRQNEEMDRRYLEDRRELERLKASEVQAIRDEYEKKLEELKSQAAPAEPDEMQKAEVEFQAYYRMAQTAVNALIDFVNFARIRTFTEKTGELLVTSAGELEEV